MLVHGAVKAFFRGSQRRKRAIVDVPRYSERSSKTTTFSWVKKPLVELNPQYSGYLVVCVCVCV